MSDDILLEELRQAVAPPAPKDFRPGVVFSGRMPSEITTDAIEPVETEEEWEAAVRAMGVHIPAGYGLVLVEAVLAGSTDPGAWHRDLEDAKENRAHSAYTKPKTTQRWRYRFKVVLKDPKADADIAVMMKEAKRATRGRPLGIRTTDVMVISLADFQVGKVDTFGDSQTMLERSEVALAAKIEEVRRVRPSQIVLIDAGDGLEGFQSAPNAARTNDLQETEQLRVWYRILWRWTEALSKLTADLVVIGVPSNHCSVRKGKQKLGTALDDWGIAAIGIISDIAAGNPEAYAHVRFVIPHEHQDHVLFELANGQILGVIHGHQVSNPNGLMDFLKKNSRAGIGQADIVVCGHFHHFRSIAFGHNQWLFVSPANDNGSSWFQYSGDVALPAVLSFFVDKLGWHSPQLTVTQEMP